MKPKTASHHRRWVLRLFEWAVLVCIIGWLCSLFLQRMGRMQALIEQRNCEATVKVLQAAVFLASTVESEDFNAEANPVTVYQQQFGILPENYLGELEPLQVASAPDGSWYFDRQEKILVYRVANKSFVEPLAQLELQIVVDAASGRLTLKRMKGLGWRL